MFSLLFISNDGKKICAVKQGAKSIEVLNKGEPVKIKADALVMFSLSKTIIGGSYTTEDRALVAFQGEKPLFKEVLIKAIYIPEFGLIPFKELVEGSGQIIGLKKEGGQLEGYTVLIKQYIPIKMNVSGEETAILFGKLKIDQVSGEAKFIFENKQNQKMALPIEGARYRRRDA